MLQASQGIRALDLAAVGEQGRGTRHCRSRQRQHHRANAQKNTLQPHRRQHWVIPPKANSAFCPARRLAPCEGHRPPHCGGLCSRLERLGRYPLANARTMVLVQDNLNIHSKASLYEAFPAAEARRLVESFEWHYTPKNSS